LSVVEAEFLSINQDPYGGMWRWTRPLKACAVLAALAMIGLIVMLVVVAKMPTVRSLAVCRTNMAAIGQAIRRYHDVNDAYPASLSQLRGVYLKDNSVLRCPLDKSEGDSPSYTYRRPSESSPATFQMLECDRHRLRKDVSISRIILQKNLEFTVSVPVPSEPAKDAEKDRK